MNGALAYDVSGGGNSGEEGRLCPEWLEEREGTGSPSLCG